MKAVIMALFACGAFGLAARLFGIVAVPFHLIFLLLMAWPLLCLLGFALAVLFSPLHTDP